LHRFYCQIKEQFLHSDEQVIQKIAMLSLDSFNSYDFENKREKWSDNFWHQDCHLLKTAFK